MPRGSWLSYFRPRSVAEIPAGLRLMMGAVSGAVLSLSFIGRHLGIYSWVCLAVFFLSLFGARPRVAFACGFLHALLFVLTSMPWVATVLSVHGGVSQSAWSAIRTFRHRATVGKTDFAIQFP